MITTLCLLCCVFGQVSDHRLSDIDRFLSSRDGIKTVKLSLAVDAHSEILARNQAYDVVLDGMRQFSMETRPSYSNRQDSALLGVFKTPDATYILTILEGRPGVRVESPDLRFGFVPDLLDMPFRPAGLRRLQGARDKLQAHRFGEYVDITYSGPGNTDVIYTISPKQGYNVVATKIMQSDTADIHTFAELEWQQYDGQWWCRRVMQYGQDGLPMIEYSVAAAEVNRPTHEKRLTLASIGCRPGTCIIDRRDPAGLPPMAGERMCFGDGNEIIPGSEYGRRIGTGMIPPPNWQPGELTQQDYARLSVTKGDMYERAALLFSRRHSFSDAQLLAAEGIADDIRAHNPAATQPAQKSKVIETSMKPRLEAMLTTRQAASAPSLNRQRPEDTAASQPAKR